MTPAQILTQFKIMITSLIEILELPNFGHMTISAIWLDSSEKGFLVEPCVEIMASWPLVQNTFF